MEESMKNQSKIMLAKGIFLTMATILFFIYALLALKKCEDKKEYIAYLNEDKIVLTGNTEQIMTLYEEYVAPCEYVYDNTLYEDERIVFQEGQKGVRKRIELVSFYNGNQVGERELSNEIEKEATPRVIRVGTKERPYYMVPTSGYVISSNYGWRWGRMHNGIDLARECGGEVYAAADGTVVAAGYVSGYGYCVDITHDNNSMTRYAHLSSILVECGQVVKKGEEIAKSGNTGNSTGPHLHFEIWFDNQPVNPTDYVEF